MKFWKWMALGVCVACLIPANSHSAASPQDDYLQIYVLINEGDKLTQSGQNSQGREKYETALTRLDKLKNENPEWEPTIVKYRIKYLNEKLDSLKSAKDSSPAPKPAPSSPPATPSSSSSDSTASPQEKTPAPQSKSEAPASLPNSSPAVTGDDPSALRQKIISLSGELESARTELRQTKNELESAVTAKKQLQEKLASSPSPDGNVAKLQEENTTLRNKLTVAEDSLKKAAGGELAGEMTSLRGQVDTLEKKLAEANGKSAELSRANDDYKKQIASLTNQLQMAGTAGKSDSTLAKENAMLRSILDRQLKEQARREAARRLVLDEFKNLAVSTEALKTQMDVLSSPLVALTDEEQGMLKVSAPSLVAPDPGSPAGNGPTISGSSEKPASPAFRMSSKRRPPKPPPFTTKRNSRNPPLPISRFLRNIPSPSTPFPISVWSDSNNKNIPRRKKPCGKPSALPPTMPFPIPFLASRLCSRKNMTMPSRF